VQLPVITGAAGVTGGASTAGAAALGAGATADEGTLDRRTGGDTPPADDGARGVRVAVRNSFAEGRRGVAARGAAADSTGRSALGAGGSLAVDEGASVAGGEDATGGDACDPLSGVTAAGDDSDGVASPGAPGSGDAAAAASDRIADD